MLKVVLQGVAKPDALCVLCHGFGAPGDDLVSLGTVLQRAHPNIAFAFPEAPLEIPGLPFGRAWWPIEVSRFERALQAGNLDALLEEVPDGLISARRALHDTVDSLARSLSLPFSQVALGGFSQGAMVATDLALRLEEAPRSLAVLSGSLIARADWSKLAPRRAGLRVLQSHGHEDPILPFAAAEALRTLLTGAGLAVDFVPFHGGHGIPEQVLHKLSAHLGAAP